MTSWLTENALVPLVTGTFLTLCFLGLGIAFRERAMFFAALLVAALTVGIGVTEHLIVTDREAVVAVVTKLAEAVQENNLHGVLKHVSDRHEEIKQSARAEMSQFKITSCRVFGITSFSTSENANPKTADIAFVVFGTGSSKNAPGSVHVKVNLKLEKEPDNQWRVIDYDYSDPHSGLRP